MFSSDHVKLITGDALTELKKLEADTVDCVITSPPYFGLRDYKHDEQLGIEKTFTQYVDRLVEIFDQVKRLLKKSGTCFVVISDSYNTHRGAPGPIYKVDGWTDTGNNRQRTMEVSEKSLCMIPERFAIKMIDYGWVLRNKIIWHKPNSMPYPAFDRFNVDWEYIYFFTKSQRYYFETQYEPLTYLGAWSTSNKEGSPYIDNNPRLNPPTENSLGRIKRSVWTIPTEAFAGQHYAVYPQRLVYECLRAGCPEFICSSCGFMRKIVYEPEQRVNTRPGLNTLQGKSGTEDDPNSSLHTSALSKHRQKIIRQPKVGGLRAAEYGNPTYSGNEVDLIVRDANNVELSSCTCTGQSWRPGLILDPFLGSGTTGLVALKNGRDFIGIDLNPQYVKDATKRLKPYLTQTRIYEY